MKIIAGLGNPGVKYEGTRHNVGFMAIDALAKKHSIAIKKKAFNALIGQSNIQGEQVLLVKPQTFMNLSGSAIKAVLNKADRSDDLLVVYDDIDIPVGKIRIRQEGSSGGHNGIASVIESLNRQDFHRMRIGIQPEYEIKDTANFVLSNFSSKEKPVIQDSIKQTVEAIETWLKEDIAKCMSLYN